MQTQYPTFKVGDDPVVVPVVMPAARDRSLSGRVRNLKVRGADISGWLIQTRAGWAVHPDFSASNFVLLEDLYRTENNEEGWLQYKRYLKAWRLGQTSRAFPAHLLPQEVQRRQNAEGPESADPWDIPPPVPTTGAVSEPKPSKGK